MRDELVDHDLRQIAPFHIIERGLVDHPERRSAAKPRQKRQTRFGGPRAKRGEVGRADLRGVAALAGVARPGIVDRDIGAAQAGFQHRRVLGAERLQLDRQQANHLPLRNHHAHPIEKRDDPLAGHLSGKVQRQDQAIQVGAVTPDNPGIEIGDDRLAVRRFPPLAPIARHRRLQAQVLNHDLFVALVARARRRLRPHHHRRANRQLVELAAAPLRRAPAFLAALVLRPSRVRRPVHARRLDRRTRRQFLQPRKLVLDRLMLDLQLGQRAAQLLVLRPQAASPRGSIAHHADQVVMRKPIERIRDARRHPKLESHFVAADSPLRPGICPGYPTRPQPIDIAYFGRRNPRESQRIQARFQG